MSEDLRRAPAGLAAGIVSSDLEWALLSIYTVRCCEGTGEGLDRFLPPGRAWFYGFGRQALAEGLRRAGVRSGDQVLMPGLIGRGVLSSLFSLGAVPRFYDVDATLCVDMKSVEGVRPGRVRAVIAVNYFGFPQPLEALRQWCRASDAALIEDNAHGFLSAEGDVPLGRRGDMGVFSLSKTLALPNGAALVDNREDSIEGEPLAYSGSPRSAEWRYRVKAMLKRCMALGGVRSARAVLAAIRMARRAATGSAVRSLSADEERLVPQEAFAPLTARLLRRLDVERERERRRSLYRLCQELLGKAPGVRPLFGSLPDGVVPQGFPFMFTGEDPIGFIEAWRGRGVQIVAWPDHLPPDVCVSAPAHYRKLMLAQFLW